jgi:hypothetical protein
LVWFWTDRWIDGRTAAEIAPLVTARIPARRKNKRTVAEAMRENRWMLDIPVGLSDEGCFQCVKLWLALAEVQCNEAVQDKFTWKGSASGKYTARETYDMLCHGRVYSSLAEPIWKAKAPLRCKIFGWLASRYRLWTSDRRARHGLQDEPDVCYTCLLEEDNVDHILAQCVFARQVWHGGLLAVNLHMVEPQQDSKLEDWWIAARDFVRREDRRRFDAFVLLTAWMLWKQRNARVFGNQREQRDVQGLINRIKEELCLWEMAYAGGSAPASRE